MDPEKRNSRLKQAQRFIFEHQYSALMNNTKWLEVFERIEIPFYIKTVLENEEQVQQIHELENTSLLYKGNGDFTEFFEIEFIRCNYSNELRDYVIRKKIEFEEEFDELVIYGYKKKLP